MIDSRTEEERRPRSGRPTRRRRAGGAPRGGSLPSPPAAPPRRGASSRSRRRSRSTGRGPRASRVRTPRPRRGPLACAPGPPSLARGLPARRGERTRRGRPASAPVRRRPLRAARCGGPSRPALCSSPRRSRPRRAGGSRTWTRSSSARPEGLSGPDPTGGDLEGASGPPDDPAASPSRGATSARRNPGRWNARRAREPGRPFPPPPSRSRRKEEAP